MLSFLPSELRKSKHRTVVESGECCTCIWRYFLQIWPAPLVGEVPRLVEVLGLPVQKMGRKIAKHALSGNHDPAQKRVY